ncbi:helix-turn-helix domain-containing protein [bacterium LRH843]|nr:helix-turn-helix domain-containing protein [bacterium LRH843]
MSELGQFLKEEREKKQLSLDDLQHTTKIQKRYLLAIEEGRYETLPGLFYARAFIKTYAEAIGLDPEPLFDQYRDELPNPAREAIVLPARSERTKKVVPPKKRTKGSSILPAVITIIVIIAVAVSIWFILQSMGGQGANNGALPPDESENVENVEFSDVSGIDKEEEPEKEAPNETPEAEIEEPAVPEDEPDTEPEIVVTLIKSEGNTSYFNLEHGRLTDVRIAFSGSSYIDVKNALGKTFYSGQPKAGEEITFDELANEEQVIFNFGASQNAQLFIAGNQVEFPLDIVHQKIAVTVLE